MSNLVRQIREAAGMSQETFAREIDRSLAMVRNYEKGAVPPVEVIDKLQTIAAAAGRGDLGVAIAAGDWEIKRVVQPGETLIRAANPAGQRLHAALDKILQSGNKQAIDAVAGQILFFADYATREKRTVEHPLKRGKAGNREVG